MMEGQSLVLFLWVKAVWLCLCPLHTYWGVETREAHAGGPLGVVVRTEYLI